MLVGQEDTAGCGNDPRSIQALLPITYRQRHVDCGQSYSGKLGTRHRTRPAQCQVGGSVGKIHAIHIVNAVITPCVTLDEVSALVGGGLPVFVDQVVPLDQYPAALERLERGEQLGKIVLDHGIR